MGNAIITTEGLTKSFGAVEALKGIDMEVEAGTVFGLLGPNGAGKTTAVRILTTLLKPDAGHATVAGFDVVRDAAALRASIGLAGQYAAVDEILTGRENLEMVGRLYRLGGRNARKRADDLLQRFDLVDAADRTVRTYSGGMRRRLDIAASLVGNPTVLFLDEPTTGLDPRSRIGLWEFIEGLVDEGTSLLLTTQYLEEADRLAKRIAVIDNGEVIAEGTSDELKDKIGGDVLVLNIIDSSMLGFAAQVVAPLGCDEPKIEPEFNRVLLPVCDSVGVVTKAVRALDEAGVHLDDLTIRRPTLDDVFLTLTGHHVEATNGETPKAGRSRRRERTEA